jgi:hypothetical protein
MRIVRLPTVPDIRYEHIRPLVPGTCMLIYHKPFSILYYGSGEVYNLEGKKSFAGHNIYIFIASVPITHTRWYKCTEKEYRLAINRN